MSKDDADFEEDVPEQPPSLIYEGSSCPRQGRGTKVLVPTLKVVGRDKLQNSRVRLCQVTQFALNLESEQIEFETNSLLFATQIGKTRYITVHDCDTSMAKRDTNEKPSGLGRQPQPKAASLVLHLA
jgi:hypothetical protein